MNRILLFCAALLAAQFAFALGDCEGLDLSISSSMNEGGPAFLEWEVVDDMGIVIADGIAQFSMDDPDYTADLCLEWGCYTLNLTGGGLWNPLAVEASLESNNVEMSVGELSLTENGLSLDFGVGEDCLNGDCPEVWTYEVAEDCVTVTFYWAYEPGPNEFAETTYAFGDGNFGLTTEMWITHTYDEPGTYEVVSTFSAEGCGIGVISQTQEIVIEDCSQTCELDVEIVQAPGCGGTFIFEAYNYPENANLEWSINEEIVDDDHYLEYDLTEIGTYIICVYYETPECPEGVFWCEGFTVEECSEGCPEEYGANMYMQCGCWGFEIGSFVEGEEVFWDWGDGQTTEGGHFAEHCYTDNGTYEVIAYYTSPDCEGEEYVMTVVVECFNICALEVEFDQTDCGEGYYVAFDYMDDVTLEWYLDSEVEPIALGTDVLEVDLEPGEHFICVGYESEICPEGVWWCHDFYVDDCENPCELDVEIVSAPECGGEFVLEAYNYPENAQIFWFMGDDEVDDDHLLEIMLNEPGAYQLCAFYETPECPEGVWWCETFQVTDCSCQLFAEYEQSECGEGIYEAFGYPENAVISWYVDSENEVYATGNSIEVDLEPGEHWVCAMYETEDCPEGVWWCHDFVTYDCEGCPTEIYMGEGEECGCFVFEIGSFVDGENVVWDWGDGSTTEGGHFAEHCYNVDGEYVVTAWYTSPECEGMLYTLGVANVNCNGDCYDVGLGFDSYPDLGGTYNLTWEISNDLLVLADGECDYQENNYCDASACLPTGCYTLSIYTTAEMPEDEEAFQWFIEGENVTWVGEPEYFIDMMGYWFIFVPFEVNNAGCGEQDCWLEIDFVEAEGGYVFWAEAPGDGVITWQFCDGSVAQGWEVFWQADLEYDCTVCAIYESVNCIEDACIEIDIEGGDDCPDDTWMEETDDCGCYQFEIGSFVEGEEVDWYFGDGTIVENGGHYIEHCFPDGVWTVTAYYESSECDGEEYFLGVAEVNCPDCWLEVSYDAIDNDSYIFQASVPEDITVTWEFGDGDSEMANQADHSYDGPGVYVVCAWYETEECGYVEECITIYVEDMEGDCPEETYIGEANDCGCFEFEIGSFVEGENVIWDFGDGTVEEGGHYITHCYEEDGEYVITGWYTSPLCEGALYTLGDVEVDCNPCDLEYEYAVTDCGLLHVEAWDYPENVVLAWYINDEIVQVGDNDLLWQAEEDGVYWVDIVYESSDCGLIWESFEFTAYVCDDCPDSIWAGEMDECGCIEFEIGSFVEGESVDWYFGDGSQAIDEGHYITHCYEVNGNYTGTVEYTSPLCPDGITIDFIVEINCDDCIEVSFAMDAEDGSIGGAEWVITNDGEPVDVGYCEYTPNMPYCDFVQCLEPGCYQMEIWTDNTITDDSFSTGVFIDGVEQELYDVFTNENQIYMSYTFGVGQDCGDGLTEVQDSPWSVYPVPASENLVIEVDMKWIGAQLRVVDMQGRLVKVEFVSDIVNTISLNSLSDGIYSVILSGNDKSESKLFSVMK